MPGWFTSQQQPQSRKRRLTQAQADQIRSIYATDLMITQKELARQFGASSRIVSEVLNNKSYRARPQAPASGCTPKEVRA